MTDVVVRLPALHVGQVRRRELVGGSGARFVVTMCGRRWGKSKDAEEWLAEGVLAGEPCALGAPTYKYLTELWRDVSEWLRPVVEATGGKISEQEKRIELPNGGVLDCWSLDTPDPGRGRKYRRFAVDEAGLVRGLAEIFASAIRPTLVDLRGSCWLYGTPKGRLHDFSVLFAKGESGERGWLSFRAPTRDNPYIPADEIEAARRDMPEAAFLQEFEGIPSDDGANPFGLDAIARCATGGLSEGAPVVWGWDFARAQDWTVGIALDAEGRVCRFHRWQGKPWGWTTEEVVRLTGRTRSFGDSTGLGDVVVEQIQRWGTPLVGVHFSRFEKQQLMERLSSSIQRGRIRFPDGPIRQELEAFQFEYAASGVRYEAPAGLHDDCVMALALAVKGLGEAMPKRPEAKRVGSEDIQGPIDWAKMRPVDQPRKAGDLDPPNGRGLFRWGFRAPKLTGRQKGGVSTIEGL